MSRVTNIRRMGWILTILGLIAAAVLLPVFAWLSKKNNNSFNEYVAWANIASMTISAFGVVLVIGDKLGVLSDITYRRLADIADSMARELKRQDGLMLAQLLSTDTLENRPASAYFEAGKPERRTKSSKKPPVNVTHEFNQIVDFYKNGTKGRLVILGAPASGKTVLAVTLAAGLLKIRGGEARLDGTPVNVPCLFHLPAWNPDMDLEEWLELQVTDQFRLGRKISARLVRDGWILPILDGLDEMDSEDAEWHRSARAVSRINEYIARTMDCRIIVVCRSGARYYEKLARRVLDAVEITVQNLEQKEILNYVQSHCRELSAWEPVLDALESQDSSVLLDELNTPWRLGAAVTFELSGGAPEDLLPTHEEVTKPALRAAYSRRVSRLLMGAWLAARISIYHERHALNALTVARLKTIARMLASAERPENTGMEIALHQWWRAFEERKVIIAQTVAMWIGVHFAFGTLGFLPIGFPKPKHGDWFELLAITTNYATIQMYCYRLVKKRSGDPVALRISSLRSARRAVIGAGGLVLAGLMGFLGSYASGPLYGIGVGASSGALIALLTASYGLDPVDATRPMATLINDRNFAFLVGLVVGGFWTLYYITLYGLKMSLMLSSMCVAGAVLSSSYSRYLVAVYLGIRRGLPFRFAYFLDSCHIAGILRLSGAGYQFRHREITDYLLGTDN